MCHIRVSVNYVRARFATSGVRVRPVGRRLRDAHLGRTFRIAAAGGVVLLEPSAHVQSARQAERQGKVQSHVPRAQPGQLRVSGTIAIPIGPAVSVLMTYYYKLYYRIFIIIYIPRHVHGPWSIIKLYAIIIYYKLMHLIIIFYFIKFNIIIIF